MIENQLLLRVPWLMKGRGGRGDGGNKSCYPIQIFLGATLKRLRARLLQWQNCPGRRALVTQIMSPGLTGKLMAEKNREWERLRPNFFPYKFPFFYWLLSGIEFKHSTIRQCCYYPEQAELSVQFKLIPFNLIDWYVASDMLLF